MDSRAHVGPKPLFDKIGEHQFETLLQAGVRKTHKVLDYGCGCLRLGKHLVPYLRKGSYTGLDVDQQLLDDGVQELTETVNKKKAPTFVLGDPENFDSVELLQLSGPYNWAVYHSIFNHASVAQVQALLAAASSYLKEGGQIIATFLGGDEDYTGEDWNYPLAHTYTPETVVQLFQYAGFTNVTLLPVEHPTGQTWVTATKPVEAKPVEVEETTSENL